MKQTHKKIIEEAKSLGIKLKIDKSLDEKYKGKILFPEKLAKANAILSKLKKPLPA
jgi:hypothetical protein